MVSSTVCTVARTMTTSRPPTRRYVSTAPNETKPQPALPGEAREYGRDTHRGGDGHDVDRVAHQHDVPAVAATPVGSRGNRPPLVSGARQRNHTGAGCRLCCWRLGYRLNLPTGPCDRYDDLSGAGLASGQVWALGPEGCDGFYEAVSSSLARTSWMVPGCAMNRLCVGLPHIRSDGRDRAGRGRTRRVLGLDVPLAERLGRKVGEVGGDDDLGASLDGGREHVPVGRVGELQRLDEG